MPATSVTPDDPGRVFRMAIYNDDHSNTIFIRYLSVWIENDVICF